MEDRGSLIGRYARERLDKVIERETISEILKESRNRNARAGEYRSPAENRRIADDLSLGRDAGLSSDVHTGIIAVHTLSDVRENS